MTLLAYLGGTWGGFLELDAGRDEGHSPGAAGAFPVPCSRPQNRVIMSMQPHPWPEVPAGTAKIARRAFRKGSLAIRARDELGTWCQDEAFGVTYGTRGAPGISPAQLAMVTVLQFTENLTDRQAADAVRGRLDWKYCLGLELADEGFDFSVLSEFRSRLVAGAMEAALLEALLARLGALGLVTAGMRQRTDSTHVLGRIRELNRPGAGRGECPGGAGGAGRRRAGLASAGDRRVLAGGLRAADRCVPAAGQQG
jgi:transposase